MNILYIFNYNKDEDAIITKEIIAYLKEKEINIYFDDAKYADRFGGKLIDDFSDINLTLILGGDGTILTYAKKHGKHRVPVLGINLGRVGALTTATITNYKELIDKYLTGQYFIRNNLTLKCQIVNNENIPEYEFDVYNDITLHRGLPNLFPFYIELNQTRVDKIYADGVIVATPSGSSAYNFSAGGPLLSHGSNCYVITPICPQSRVFSSLVVSNEEIVTIKLQDAIEEVYLSVDGCERYPINKNYSIVIMKSEQCLPLVNFKQQTSPYDAVHKVMNANSRRD